jgi:lysylphosphatidylglycerol synthetase-like protein (DUF2156 family)
MKPPKMPGFRLNRSLVTDALLLVPITLGVLLLVAGLLIIILSASLPAQASDVDSTTQSIVFVMSQIPGVPLNFNDLANGSLTMIGMVSWIIGLDIILIGLGLRARSRFAKWIAMGVFVIAAFFDLVTFLNVGILGSFGAFIGIFINGFFVYLFSKVDF